MGHQWDRSVHHRPLPGYPGHMGGFTLVELLTIMVVAAVLALLAVPNLNEFIKNNRLISQINTMVGAINLARSEAVERNQSVTVCPSTDLATCTGGDWEDGMIVFADPANQGVVDAGESLVRVEEALSGRETTLRSALTRITFGADGFSIGFEGTLTLCDGRTADKAMAVIIRNSGQVYTAMDTDADGIREDHAGSDLSCP